MHVFFAFRNLAAIQLIGIFDANFTLRVCKFSSFFSSYIAIALEAAAPALGVGAHKRVNESGKTPLSSRQFEGHNSSSSKNAEWKNMLRREVASAISELQSFILNNMTIVSWPNFLSESSYL